ncbi:MAG: ABC transporter substrate-binding protein [Acidobacteriota bacterium]
MTRQSRPLLTLLLIAAITGTIWMAWRSMTPAPPAADRLGAPPAPVRGGTLTSSIRSEVRSYNRISARDYPTELLATLTLGRLVRVNRATHDVEPWLAESWTTSADALTYTFTLRDGVTWNDGTPFTSADVAFSFQAVYDPSAKSVLRNSLLVGGQPLRIDTPDPHTVVVTFAEPFGPGVRLLDNLTIMPRHKLEAALAGGTFADAWSAATPPADLAAIGPFQLARYDPGQRIVLDRNPRYWRTDERGEALPYLDRLVLEIVPDQDAELVRLQSGQIDLTQQQLRAADVATLRPLVTQGRLQLLEIGVANDVDHFFFNLRPAQWARDPRRAWLPRREFRQAISHAVDREAYADTVFLGEAVPIHGPITPGNRLWFWPGIPRYEFSRDKARALLAGLGLQNRDADEWLEDERGTEARFSLITVRGNTQLERGAAVVRDELRQIGVAMDIVPLEANALIKRMLDGQFEAIFFVFGATDLDPALSPDLWLSSGSAHVWNIGQRTPATDWEARIDALMAEQARATDLAERQRLFREVQRIFSEELPMIHFAAARLYMGVSARVFNLSPGFARPHLLWSADTISVTPAGPATSQ